MTSLLIFQATITRGNEYTVSAVLFDQRQLQELQFSVLLKIFLVLDKSTISLWNDWRCSSLVGVSLTSQPELRLKQIPQNAPLNLINTQNQKPIHLNDSKCHPINRGLAKPREEGCLIVKITEVRLTFQPPNQAPLHRPS